MQETARYKYQQQSIWFASQKIAFVADRVHEQNSSIKILEITSIRFDLIWFDWAY